MRLSRPTHPKETLHRWVDGVDCSLAGGRAGAHVFTAFVFFALAMCPCVALHAQSSGINGAAGVSSQLVDRGIAITPPTPTLQGALSWTSPGGWSFGVLGSAEVRSPDRVVEASAQISRYWSLSSDWQIQASMLYYNYPDSRRARAFDRTETSVNWMFRDILTLGLSAIHVVGTGAEPRGAADVDFHWPLPWHLYLSAGAGIAQSLVATQASYNYGQSSIYRYGHAGLAWDDGHWRVELERITSDSHGSREWGNLNTSPWVATLSRSF
jgi:uncharacterized protein (TIGR02001 family)